MCVCFMIGVIIVVLILMFIIWKCVDKGNEMFINENALQTDKEIYAQGINCMYSPYNDNLHCKSYPEWYYYTYLSVF